MERIANCTNCTLTGLLSGGDGTGGVFGGVTTSLIGIFAAVQKIAVTCGVASAVCAIILAAIFIATANRPQAREELKGRINAIAIGCIFLGGTGLILAVAANIGASF